MRNRMNVKDTFTVKDAYRNLEKHGLTQILQNIKTTKVYGLNLYILEYVHDADGSARNVVGKFFPCAIESLCVSHLLKNKTKGLSNEWKLRIKKSILYAFKHASKNDFQHEVAAIFQRYLKHFQNDHSSCIKL